MPRTQGAQLVLAPVQGEVGDQVRVGPVDASPGLDVLQVRGLAEAVFHGPGGAVGAAPLQGGHGELQILAPGTQPRGDVAEQGVDQFVHAAGDIRPAQVGAEQAHPAVDVVAHAARGHHALFQVEGRHPADGETIAPMDVGHGQGGPHDPRQGGHVGHLLEAPVLLDLGDHLPGSKHQPPGAHLPFLRHLPAILVDLP